ncbi:WYL domain-containing protein [Nitrosospira sp. Nsp18]|nr:WYL domain-containing protein [Nitrosospira sp. Nsp18]
MSRSSEIGMRVAITLRTPKPQAPPTSCPASENQRPGSCTRCWPPASCWAIWNPASWHPMSLLFKHVWRHCWRQSGHSATEITRRVACSRWPSGLSSRGSSPTLRLPYWNASASRSMPGTEVGTRPIPGRFLRNAWFITGTTGIAWCHLRNDLRSFSVDAIQRIKVLREKARNVASAKLDSRFASAYGIFGGQATAWAILRFPPECARWGQSERWHSE